MLIVIDISYIDNIDKILYSQNKSEFQQLIKNKIYKGQVDHTYQMILKQNIR